MANIEKRTNNKGEVSYRVKVRLKGYPTQSATFSRLTDARKWEQSVEASIREGRHFKTAEAKKHTLGELIDRYTSEVLALKKKSTANQKHYLKYWKDHIGERVLADVSPALITEYRNKLVGTKNRYGKEISPVTANRYTTALGHVFAIAVNEWEWLDNNPVRRIKKYPESKGRVRFLSDDERGALLDACKQSENPYLYAIVVLAISTGARKNELLSLRWSQVNLKRGLITLEETKNDERRSLPLRGQALELIEERNAVRHIGCDYVFPSSKVKKNAAGKPVYQPIDIRTAWENALTRAEITNFRFHDLRHTCSSYLAMNGATLAEIAEVLGHKTLQMVKRYAHLSESHTASVVEKMNKKVFG